MCRNWLGELQIMKDNGIKPNFSDLERRYHVDRHKLKRCYENGGLPQRKKRSYTSKWDPFFEEIKELMEKPGTSKSAAFHFLENKYERLPGSYNGFRSYTRRKGIVVTKTSRAHVLYESAPGELIQFDWKEDLSITLVDGSILKFNVFSATLAYSREHIFLFSYTKTRVDVIRCLIKTFRKLGGTPKMALTDNMSAIVSIRSDGKHVHATIRQLMKDLDIKLLLSKSRTPQTKGKDENANKFLSWLRPYEGTLKDVDEVIHIIEDVITSQSNRQVNQATNIPPAVLFEKEKEYLIPITNGLMLESYLTNMKRTKVPETLLINYEGSRYSVPQKYIGRLVDVYAADDIVYILHEQDIVATHTISQHKIHYESAHYEEALRSTGRIKEEDIEKFAMKNLKRLKNLGGKG